MAAVTLRRDATVGHLVALARAAAPVVVRWGRRARSLVLHLGGLGCLTAAASLVAVPLGLVVAGAALLVLQYLTAEP
jgi:hypothetical protein